jgi:hypothetical protein
MNMDELFARYLVFLRDTVIAIVVGMVLLLLLTKLIARVQFSLSTAFWCSFLGHTLGSIIALFVGLVTFGHMGLAITITLVIGWAFQTLLFQVFVRGQRATLSRWRAAILSLIVILGDFFVASPLIELWEHLRQ